MQIDKFGRPANSINYGNEKFTAVEWDSESIPGKILLRGDYSDPCLIKCVDQVNHTITWGSGNWADRAGLEYGDDRLMNVGV